MSGHVDKHSGKFSKAFAATVCAGEHLQYMQYSYQHNKEPHCYSQRVVKETQRFPQNHFYFICCPLHALDTHFPTSSPLHFKLGGCMSRRKTPAKLPADSPEKSLVYMHDNSLRHMMHLQNVQILQMHERNYERKKL